MPFRSITRVPCLWSEPGDRTARSTAAMASTIDLSASILDRAGFTDLALLEGSMNRWEKERRPVEKGAPPAE